MKILTKSVLIIAVIAFAGNAYSQGRIGFANDPRQPLYNMDGTTTGTDVMVSLYYSDNLTADPDTFAFSGATTFTQATPPFNGVFNYGSAVVLPFPADTLVVAEVRAWDNGAASWEEALALGTGNVGRGVTPNAMMLAGATASAPNLITQGGFTSFTLTPVPEPSTIALGILGGLGAMVLLRRRR
jgi:hypothetical protein